MPESVSFYRAEYDVPGFSAADDAYSAIGSMLTSDVQNAEVLCLDRLAWTENVRSGRSVRQSWQGNSWLAEVSARGLHLQDMYSDDWVGDYSLDDAHLIMHRYLDFLTPSRDSRLRAVAAWESEQEREHPCRAHL